MSYARYTNITRTHAGIRVTPWSSCLRKTCAARWCHSPNAAAISLLKSSRSAGEQNRSVARVPITRVAGQRVCTARITVQTGLLHACPAVLACVHVDAERTHPERVATARELDTGLCLRTDESFNYSGFPPVVSFCTGVSARIKPPGRNSPFTIKFERTNGPVRNYI